MNIYDEVTVDSLEIGDYAVINDQFVRITAIAEDPDDVTTFIVDAVDIDDEPVYATLYFSAKVGLWTDDEWNDDA